MLKVEGEIKWTGQKEKESERKSIE